MQGKISIIIPVYNVEHYLKEALDSVLYQTYTNWEAICVNDGSTDNSLEILREYAQKDSRFIVINQENGGVSKARNVGLENASGEYIIFLDSDDYLENYACEKALKAITETHSDICIFAYFELKNNVKNISNKFNIIDNHIRLNTKIPAGFSYTIYDRIYKRNFIEKNQLRFIEGLKTCEDIIFTLMTFFQNAKISYLNKSLYVYRVNRVGSETTGNINGLKTDIQALKILYSLPIYQKQDDNIKKMIINRWLFSGIYYYTKFSNLRDHLILSIDILKLIKYLKEKNPKYDFDEISNYNNLKSIIKKSFLEHFNIFSHSPQKFSDDNKKYLEEIHFSGYLKKLKRKLGKKPIVIYGAGILYKYIQENFDLSDLNIIGISDARFTDEQNGEKIFNTKVISKNQLKNENFQYLLVATKNYDGIIKEFKSNLLKKSKIKILPLAKQRYNFMLK